MITKDHFNFYHFFGLITHFTKMQFITCTQKFNSVTPLFFCFKMYITRLSNLYIKMKKIVCLKNIQISLNEQNLSRFSRKNIANFSQTCCEFSLLSNKLIIFSVFFQFWMRVLGLVDIFYKHNVHS